MTATIKLTALRAHLAETGSGLWSGRTSDYEYPDHTGGQWLTVEVAS